MGVTVTKTNRKTVKKSHDRVIGSMVRGERVREDGCRGIVKYMTSGLWVVVSYTDINLYQIF